MSYSCAAALQSAIFAELSGAAGLASVMIVDAIPTGGGTGTFVLLGPEDALDASDKSGQGAEHRVVISVISDARGFLEAKEIAATISDVLVGATPAMSTGRIVSIGFAKAVAKRLKDGDVRRIDLTFRVRIEL